MNDPYVELIPNYFEQKVAGIKYRENFKSKMSRESKVANCWKKNLSKNWTEILLEKSKIY